MAYTIAVQVGLSETTASVSATGGGIAISSNAEATAFDVTEALIVDIFARIKGRAPDEGYRQNPVRGNEIFGTSGSSRSPVDTNYRVKRATLTSITSTVEVAASQVCDNSAGTEPVPFDPQLSASPMNTIDSGMAPADAVAIGVPAHYAVSFEGTGCGIPRTYDFDQQWAESFHLESPANFSIGVAEPISVPAGSVVTAEMLLSVGTMTIDIEYELALSGLTLGYYNKPLDDHYFYFYDVNAGLRLFDRPTTIAATQTLTILFYADPELQIVDNDGRPRV